MYLDHGFQNTKKIIKDPFWIWVPKLGKGNLVNLEGLRTIKGQKE
jgi:hypothetical protein